MQVRFKMLCITITGLVFVLAVGILGMNSTKSVENNSQDMYDNRVVPVQRLNQIEINTRQILLDTTTVIIANENGNVSLDNQMKAEINDLINQNNQLVSELSSEKLDAYEKTNLPKLKAQLNMYRATRATVVRLSDSKQGTAAKKIYFAQLMPQYDQMQTTLSGLAQYNAGLEDKTLSQNTFEFNRTSTISIVITVLAVIILAGVAVVIARIITRPIKELQSAMALAADGDFTVKVII